MNKTQKEIDQQAYTTVALHLLAQNEKSFVLEVEDCAYRDDRGNKCAIGALIDDRDYRPTMENQTAGSLKIQALGGKMPNSPLMKLSQDLANALQWTHDIHNVDMWPHHLRDVGEDHELEIPEEVIKACA